MAAGHVAGTGASAAVTTVGGVFAGLISAHPGKHEHLAQNPWFVLSLVIAIAGAVALVLVLLHWAWTGWKNWRGRRRREGDVLPGSPPTPKAPEPGIDAPGEYTATTRDPSGGEDIERRTFERERQTPPAAPAVVDDVGAHNATVAVSEEAAGTPGIDAPGTETRTGSGLTNLGRTLRKFNEAVTEHAAEQIAPVTERFTDAVLKAVLEAPGTAEGLGNHFTDTQEPEPPGVRPIERVTPTANPDADWPSKWKRIRHGARLMIDRPPNDRGRITSCKVTRVADDRSWTYSPGMTPMGPTPLFAYGLDTFPHEVEFPRDFRDAGSRARPGRYAYRWTAVYGGSVIPTSSDTVAEGEFSI